MESKTRHAPPRAGAMIESLRGLGYSTASALADIIDNSISACARSVELIFGWEGESSYIAILDDGTGMNDEQLETAMRLGERNPLDTRDSADLGRFGLGLKTASFSQCRRLTVASRREQEVSCLRWDLDVLKNSAGDGWILLEGPAPETEKLLGPLSERDRGTIVIWDKLDRIVTTGFGEQDFLNLMDTVERHLAMVFHRYVEGPRPKLTLRINGRAIRAWDPFLSSHPATWASPATTFQSEGGCVTVQAFVLPHKDRLSDSEHKTAGGPDGWTAQQGFYVYRNERLLVAGSWLGLGRGRSWPKEEAHRLARIQLDISNTADTEWKIDIRKSTARPPVGSRERLTRLAEDARERARRVFAHRGRTGRTGAAGPVRQAWRAEHFSGGMRYRLDEEHPAIASLLEDGGELAERVRAMLRVIEETVPVQRIWLDTTEARETPRTGFEGGSPEEVHSVLNVLYRNLVTRKGILPERAREQLLATEPFNNYPQLVLGLPDQLQFD
ncbi:Histidine kinase-, DNA gyrase B-, and HSP90-like ATPase [Paraburkholderia unamae]|nr:Histidine kinase-, DNA gyrase B-, and HSP90-like ATPase [Paraburkholderia unamae]